MPQIKLGFDKIPVPSVKTLQPLYDIVRGVPLVDANGNTIVTEAEGPLAVLAKAQNSTSINVNNDDVYTVKIEEQFPETSEVSTTLLGIPRAETQLSLFSDVSTYGINPEEWEFYNFTGFLRRPAGWYSRRNQIFGNHYYSRLVEEVNEQALVLQTYPVAYSFPYGPRYGDFSGAAFDEAQFERFLNFVDLGNYFYDYYFSRGYETFAKRYFLDPQIIYTESSDIVYPDDEQLGYDLIENWCQAWMDLRDGIFIDPVTEEALIFPTGYDATNTRPGYSSSIRSFGSLQSRKAYRYQPGRISGFTFGFKASRDEASTDNIIEWGIGNPSDQYVFQIRGPQFNIVRRSTVPLPNDVLRRMGLREEDQVLTQSTEPFVDTSFYELVISRDFFNGDPLNGNGRSGYLLDPTKVTMYKIEFGWYGAIGAKFYAYIPTDTGDARWVLLHTLVIENSLNEPCLEDPYFKFRYIQDIRNTSNIREPQFLYKYGASCYIDGGDNTAGKVYTYSSDENIINNVRDNTLIGILPKQEIFNQDGIAKPNKKNTYPTDMKIDCDQLTEVKVVEVDGCPAFGHHYSPSLHAKQNGITRSINLSASGGDITINPNPPVNITNVSTTDPVVVTTETAHGYYTGQKVNIIDVVGTVEVNDIEYYIRVVSDTEFDLYSEPSLTTTVNGSGFSTYVSGGIAEGNPILLDREDDSKLIANGIWSSYTSNTSETTADIQRIGFSGRYDKSSAGTIPEQVYISGEEPTDVSALDLSQVRFSAWSGIAASTYPITGDTVDINFLNPVSRDGFGHFAEFLIGVTEFRPTIITEQTPEGTPVDRLRFLLKDGITDVPPSLDDVLYAEFTQANINRNRDGYEVGEGDNPAGVLMDIDFRLPRPSGADSGTCSGLRASIMPRLEYLVTYSSTNPDTGEPGNFVVWDSAPTQLISGTSLTGGEFGIDGSPSGIRFLGEITEYIADAEQQTLGYYAEINAATSSTNFSLGLSPVKLEDKMSLGSTAKTIQKVKIFSYNVKPLYVTVWMRDNARVNNITFTEFINGTQRAFSPEWLVNDGIDVVFSGGSQSGVPAANYLEAERLSGATVDTQNTQPLRPGKIKDTLYVAPNSNNTVKLDSIYGPDRTVITPGALNTKATFITARSLIDNSLNLVSVNVNTKEE